MSKATQHAQILADALRAKGIAIYPEYNDGHKTVDIAIHDARLYIEVDGIQHNLDPVQILADLEREHYSDIENYRTMRIPNYMIDQNLQGVAAAIDVVVKKRRLDIINLQ